MPETRTQATEAGQKRITELRVSGHLMTLDTGTFCVFHAPGSATGSDSPLGLPGVRISLPPAPMRHPDDVTISTFRPDGWLGGNDAAALIRVASGPAQVLVTIYQAPGQGSDSAPRLQVLRLNPEPGNENPVAPARAGNGLGPEDKPEVLVHVQVSGDVGGRLGEWAGEPGSRNWIEGFSIVPPAPLQADDIEYQAVLGRGWLSPWVTGGQFCGSRGMALPLLGLRVRLKGEAHSQYRSMCQATFVDGTELGPLPSDAAIEAESLAPLEAFQIILTPVQTAKTADPARKPGTQPSMTKVSPAKSALPKVAAKAKPAAVPEAAAKAPSQPKRPLPSGRPAR